jgi:hypothetical protein
MNRAFLHITRNDCGQWVTPLGDVLTAVEVAAIGRRAEKNKNEEEIKKMRR